MSSKEHKDQSNNNLNNSEETNKEEKRFVFTWDMYNQSEQMNISEGERIRFPRLLLWYHITSKGFQIGSTAGMIAGIPSALIDSRFNISLLRANMWSTMVTSSVQYSLLGAAIFGAFATYFTKWHYNTKEIDSLSYRIYHNQMMKEWETIGWTGAIVGALVGMLKSPTDYSRIYTIFRSTVVGSSIGMTAFGVLQAKRYLID
jgi:uncharacterized membrane protein YeaQ/YmgE (transglycosylase-associated protein family)